MNVLNKDSSKPSSPPSVYFVRLGSASWLMWMVLFPVLIEPFQKYHLKTNICHLSYRWQIHTKTVSVSVFVKFWIICWTFQWWLNWTIIDNFCNLIYFKNLIVKFFSGFRLIQFFSSISSAHVLCLLLKLDQFASHCHIRLVALG